MRRRRLWTGSCVGVLGGALILPLNAEELKGFDTKAVKVEINWKKPAVIYGAGSIVLDGGSTLWALSRGAKERNLKSLEHAALAMTATAGVLLLADAWLQTKGSAWGWRVLRVLASGAFLALAGWNILVGVNSK